MADSTVDGYIPSSGAVQNDQELEDIFQGLIGAASRETGCTDLNNKSLRAAESVKGKTNSAANLVIKA